MSNFSFLQAEWAQLFNKTKKAEERVNTEPYSTARDNRWVLEACLHHIYKVHHISFPYNTQLINLLSDSDIQSIIPSEQINGLHLIRKTGNNASHYGKIISSKSALESLRYLYVFLKWFALNYSETEPILPAAFDTSHIPKIGAKQRALKLLQKEQAAETAILKKQLADLQAQRETLKEEAESSALKLAVYEAEKEADRAALLAQRQARIQVIPAEFNEAETRKHLIDANLIEAGWQQLATGRDLEYPVKGMPISPDNPKGNGYADYVLWDDNGLPLAIIEAKRTNKDVEVGRHQATLYANCLEQMHGQRPIIFYTNGYETHIWEDTFYSAPRIVHGFYTKEELQWRIQQRNTRKDLRTATVNPEIAGRPYQMEAIQRVAENLLVKGTKLRGKQRNVLLVMATGSGKTRTAAALVEILFKHNWAKRVLFLADRNALVKQAKDAFGEHLPDYSAVNLSKDKESNTTRLVFSTYPSMMNRIDGIRQEGERFYGVGHFDLIIVDEAHRSVYNRYKAIFDYFDALLVGLTATPKGSIDHNTYELFGCATEDPTFNYDLEEATPLYLKPYQNFDIATDFLREGIKYHELSASDQAKYEETFRDATTGLFPEEIAANAMNKWLFNKDTVNKVLDKLMEEGIKIEGGDKLGRTIVFAVNQKHAAFIVKCFRERYPEQASGFIETIHNGISHAQSLITAFCDKEVENYPQVAVSVDMMDTGIDAPRVLNLVFFKVVRSYAKFWQMIGRGTRLCPDVFGPDDPKEYFKIFDVCQNFEFFNIHQKGKEARGSKPLSRQIFEARLQLSRLLAETGIAENAALANQLLDRLHAAIKKLDRERFQVKMQLRYVDEFKGRDRWNNLSADDVHKIETHLSALPVPESIPEKTRRFDLLLLKLQIAKLLALSAADSLENRLSSIADILSKKYTIPEVLKAAPLIDQLKKPDFYKQLSQARLEEIRLEIRELVKYMEGKSQQPLYTDIQDSAASIVAGDPIQPYTSAIYKQRVERFLRTHKDQLTIAKLANNKPITEAELLLLEKLLFDGEERGTKADFIKAYGEQPLGAFVRSILGLKVAAAHQAFADFLQVGHLQADQMTFLQNIITYLTKNGTLEKRMLFQAPFTDMHDQGILGVFKEAQAGRIIRIIDEINGNAGVA